MNYLLLFLAIFIFLMLMGSISPTERGVLWRRLRPVVFTAAAAAAAVFAVILIAYGGFSFEFLNFTTSRK